jgi:hypothetical protein
MHIAWRLVVERREWVVELKMQPGGIPHSGENLYRSDNGQIGTKTAAVVIHLGMAT